MIYLLLSIILLCILLFIFTIVRWNRLKPFNQIPLKIKTFDGLDSPYHPSVLYFPTGWNGWKYWMAETPFSPKCKPYIDRNECPSIHVSNDGINWQTPEGLQNPITNFGAEGENNLDYYSDPHLVMVNGEMECWFRLTERHGDVNHRHEVSLRKRSSSDGINWSDEEIISNLWKNKASEGLGKMVVSPALTWADNRYSMWFVNSEDQFNQRGVSFSKSKNGYDWENKIECNFFGKEINPWHIDVYKEGKNQFYMVVYDLHELTLWQSADGINWNYINTLLSPSKAIGSFYRNGLYRSCLIKEKDNYRLYFSAYDFDNTYIGTATFQYPGDKITFYSNKLNHTFLQFFFYNIKYEYRHLKFILNHLIGR